jgi:hypothetical protein
MKTQPENFQDLKRLLAVKRHEQPPDHFFEKLSDQIHEGIHTPRPSPPTSWRQRLRQDLDLRVVALGVGICALIVGGTLWAIYGQRPLIRNDAPGENSGMLSTRPLLPPTAAPPILTPKPGTASVQIQPASYQPRPDSLSAPLLPPAPPNPPVPKKNN